MRVEIDLGNPDREEVLDQIDRAIHWLMYLAERIDSEMHFRDEPETEGQDYWDIWERE